MALFSSRRRLLSFLLVGIFLAGAMQSNVMAQCGCAATDCCSQHGFCGSDDEYCGFGCQSGPCYAANSVVSVPDIVTPQFFNGIKSQASPDCVGQGFYTREAFLSAVNSFRDFGKLRTEDDSKREIAAFFAHITHETGHFCHIEEDEQTRSSYCQEDAEYPCVPGKSYYGRGPIQLTGNRNYGAAGNAVGFDGLNNPEIVATDPVLSFETALWFWLSQVRDDLSQGFGATIRAINGPLECDGKAPEKVNNRIRLYTDYCSQFGVAPGDNLSC